MSVRTVKRSSSFTSPIAIPATGALIGTPASINDSEDPQTLAIELDPLDSVISDTTRIVYGKSSILGRHELIPRRARRPCPTSRRLTPITRPVSPTQYGGKL